MTRSFPRLALGIALLVLLAPVLHPAQNAARVRRQARNAALCIRLAPPRFC